MRSQSAEGHDGPGTRAGGSIQRRLLWSMIAVLVAGIALTAAVVYRQARDEANALFDLQLRQLAAALPVRALGGLAPQALNGPAADEDVVIRIWNRYGVFVYSSHPDVALPAKAQIGLTTIATRRGDWRVFATLVDDNLLEVAQPMSVRSALAAEVAARTVLPLVVLLPILAGLLWWVVGRGLAPLRRVAEEVATRRPEALERLSEEALPREVAPLVSSLNHLLDDLASARDAQRAFIADAAHELRTPLTALQLQLQIVQRAENHADRTLAIDALRAGLLRASRLVEQLLALARTEPDATSSHAAPPVDLAVLAGEAVTLHAGLADDRGIDLGLIDRRSSEEAVLIDGDRDALFTLLSNLIDNALRYTPRGGRIDVVVARDERRVLLSVIDDGPGIAAHERQRVFDRFHRGDAARSAGDSRGSGLGLAIVKRIAERHGASVALLTPESGRGLRVDVSF
jgi:two-component system OmpR family sensor kinase